MNFGMAREFVGFRREMNGWRREWFIKEILKRKKISTLRAVIPILYIYCIITYI